MPSKPTFVVIGAGQAGAWAVDTMRAQGFDGRIVLLGEEEHLPYERPPLSKSVLAGDDGIERTFFHDRAYYDENGIELRLGARATGIDPAERRVHLAGGATLAYDKLLLATGSRVRALSVPGSDLPGIHYLRGIDDMVAIRDALKPGARLVVVGGGYIGLEVAATARKRRCRVTVIETEDVVMSRVVAPQVGRFYADVHRRHGVEIRTRATVTRFAGDGRAERVVCGDGTDIPADLVVVGIGIVPNTELAEAAGLVVENGIAVDEFGRTSDPHIFAAGDVANHLNPLLGRRLRLESWQNAQNQAIAVARAMCGDPVPYSEVPWFWSDQYDLNLQLVGAPERWDETILRGDMADRKFTVFYLAGGTVVAANAVNNAPDIRPARKFIEEKRRVDPKRLADGEIPLKKLL